MSKVNSCLQLYDRSDDLNCKPICHVAFCFVLLWLCKISGDVGPTLSSRLNPRPRSPPDAAVSVAVSREQALLYRLSGDYNAIHADHEAARAAGLDGPILHGLCSLGVSEGSGIREAGDSPSFIQVPRLLQRRFLPIFRRMAVYRTCRVSSCLTGLTLYPNHLIGSFGHYCVTNITCVNV